MKVVVFDQYCTRGYQVYRMSSQTGWANYRYSAPHMNNAQHGQHIVTVDMAVQVPDGSVTTIFKCADPSKVRRNIHFKTAGQALEFCSTFLGPEGTKGLFVLDGFLARKWSH